MDVFNNKEDGGRMDISRYIPPPVKPLECVYEYNPYAQWTSMYIPNYVNDNTHEYNPHHVTIPLCPPDFIDAATHNSHRNNTVDLRAYDDQRNDNNNYYTPTGYFQSVPLLVQDEFSTDVQLPLEMNYINTTSNNTTLKLPNTNNTLNSELLSIQESEYTGMTNGFKQLTENEVEIEIEKINEIYKNKLKQLQQDSEPTTKFIYSTHRKSNGRRKPRKKRFDKISLQCPIEGCPYNGQFKTADYAKRHIREQHGGSSKAYSCHGTSDDNTEWGCKKSFKRLYQLHNHWKRESSKRKCNVPLDVLLYTTD